MIGSDPLGRASAYADSITIPITFSVPAIKIPKETGRFDSLEAVILPANGWPQGNAEIGAKTVRTASGLVRDIGPSQTFHAQFEPGDEPLGPGAEQTIEELRAKSEGRPVAPSFPPRPFAAEEIRSLTQLFGQSVAGAKSLLQRLETEGSVPLPPGLDRAVLERYAKVAEIAIARGQDKIGTQALRLAAIRLIIRGLP